MTLRRRNVNCVASRRFARRDGEKRKWKRRMRGNRVIAGERATPLSLSLSLSRRPSFHSCNRVGSGSSCCIDGALLKARCRASARTLPSIQARSIGTPRRRLLRYILRANRGSLLLDGLMELARPNYAPLLTTASPPPPELCPPHLSRSLLRRVTAHIWPSAYAPLTPLEERKIYDHGMPLK